MAEPEPAVIRTLREFRLALDGRDDAALRELARQYLMVQAGIEADLTALAYEMAARRAEGKIITEQMIYREQRFKYAKAQLEEQIARFNADALATIERGQMDGGQLGIRAANEAIAASYTDVGAIGPYWNRLNVNAIESMVGFAQDGTPLKKLLRRAYPDAVDGIVKALINGMGRGLGPGQVATDMIKGSGMGLTRAVLISRTELARAYRTGSTKQYRESGVVNGFYRLVKKETACAACLMLDGQTFDTAEELHDHPAGKCVAVPGVIGVGKPKWEEGPEWFMRQPPEEQRRILGSGRYELWQAGKIELSDVAKVRHSDEWGDQPAVATVAELSQ